MFSIDPEGDDRSVGSSSNGEVPTEMRDASGAKSPRALSLSSQPPPCSIDRYSSNIAGIDRIKDDPCFSIVLILSLCTSRTMHQPSLAWTTCRLLAVGIRVQSEHGNISAGSVYSLYFSKGCAIIGEVEPFQPRSTWWFHSCCQLIFLVIIVGRAHPTSWAAVCPSFSRWVPNGRKGIPKKRAGTVRRFQQTQDILWCLGRIEAKLQRFSWTGLNGWCRQCIWAAVWHVMANNCLPNRAATASRCC